MISRPLFIALASLYALSILIYIIYSIVKKTKLALLPVFMFLPLIGPAIIISVMIGASYKKNTSVDLYEDEEVQGEKYDYLTQINDEKDINIVPMKEAMVMNEKNTQRNIVFELAKGDPVEFIKNLKQALLSEDSEVAHYAASSISKFKRELDKTLSDCESEFSERPDIAKNRNALISALDDAIVAELATSEEITRMQNRITEILMMEIRLGDTVVKEQYDMLCGYLLKVEDYSNFENWLREFQVKFPTADEPLRYKLKYAYKMHDKVLFTQMISEVERAKYAITKETLNMLNFWHEEL